MLGLVSSPVNTFRNKQVFVRIPKYQYDTRKVRREDGGSTRVRACSGVATNNELVLLIILLPPNEAFIRTKRAYDTSKIFKFPQTI